MRVLKIIQANPEVFNKDQSKSYSEKEAIRILASMDCSGNEVQNEIFDIRQTHSAIFNLMDLGYRNTAVELATKLIPRSEQFHQFKIAQDLCDLLITHFYQEGNPDAIQIYKTLYDKYTLLISGEHLSKILFGKAIQNYKYEVPINKVELTLILNSIQSKLPYDTVWYHYYYYQCKSLMLGNEVLEQTYLDAIAYFEGLYLQHSSFIRFFCEGLVQFYKDKNALDKAEKIIQKIQGLKDSDY